VANFIRLVIGMSFLLLSSYALTNSGVSARSEAEEHVLRNFAYANCLFWHFKEKGYDVTDIKAISGGYVENSTISAETFQEIALIVKEYSPALDTKHNIDPTLYKCFF